MDILSIMRSRYTTKHYDPSKPVSEEALQTMLEVLRLSPSSVNSQPWHFYVIESAEAKAKLMPAVKDFNIERMKAPVFILFTVSTKLGPQYWEALYQQEDADGRFAGWTSPERPDAIRMMAAERLEADPAELFLYNSNQAYLALGCLTVAAETLGVDSTILGGLDFDQVKGPSLRLLSVIEPKTMLMQNDPNRGGRLKGSLPDSNVPRGFFSESP